MERLVAARFPLNTSDFLRCAEIARAYVALVVGNPPGTSGAHSGFAISECHAA
jgi:hypothetical protein